MKSRFMAPLALLMAGGAFLLLKDGAQNERRAVSSTRSLEEIIANFGKLENNDLRGSGNDLKIPGKRIGIDGDLPFEQIDEAEAGRENGAKGGYYLDGRVVNEISEGVSGAEIKIARHEDESSGRGGEEVVSIGSSNEEGFFSFLVGNQTAYDIFVSTDEAGGRLLQVMPSEEKDGNPLTLTIDDLPELNLTFLVSRGGAPPLEAILTPDGECGIERRKKFERGVWTIRGIEPGYYSLSARGENHYARESTYIAEGERKFVDIVLSEAVNGRLIVTDEKTSWPIKGAEVRVIPLSDDEYNLTTDSRGEAMAKLFGDSFRFEFSHPDYLSSSFSIGFSTDYELDPIEIELSPAYKTRGRVTSNDGKPIEDVHIELDDSDRFSVTDENGEFVIGGLAEDPEMNYIRVVKEGYQPHIVREAKIGGNLLIELDREVLLQGRLTHRGEPIKAANLEISVLDPLLPHGDATTSGEDGSYALPASYGLNQIRVNLEGKTHFVRPVVPDGAETFRYDIDIKGEGLEGILQTREGIRLADIVISATPGPRYFEWAQPISTRTNEIGEWSLEVGDGVYSVRACGENGRLDETWEGIAAPSTANLVADVLELRIDAHDEQGTQIDGANLVYFLKINGRDLRYERRIVPSGNEGVFIPYEARHVQLVSNGYNPVDIDTSKQEHLITLKKE